MTDLSAFLAAVKPSGWTDNYKVLAALYSLNASREAVTTRQISKHLSLHLGKKIPSNISAALRRLSPFVRMLDSARPGKWLLTPEGIEKLKDLSRLDLSSNEEEQFQTDVGIVCALEHPEFAAVRHVMGGEAAWLTTGSRRFSHIYRSCTITTLGGTSLSVIGTTSTSMGLTAASIVTTQLILQFRPRFVLMIGIAAGTRDGNKQYGDILVADPSVDYNSGKVVGLRGIREFLPDPYPIGLNPRLRSVLQKYRANSDVFNEIKAGWTGHKPASSNRLHLGPLGAADQVIDDASRVLEIQRNWRKLIGVEMETYGVYRACYEAPDPKPRFASFKAVCDFAAEKSDSWQEYAAYTASQFAVRFLRTEWESLWSKP